MKRRRFTVCTAALTLISTMAAAQAQHHADWGNSGNPRVKMISGPDSSDSKLYLLAPGHYVQNPSDRADYWSPHVRPSPDFSHASQPRNITPLPRNRLGGTWRGAQPSTVQTTGGWCGTGYGCNHAPFYNEAAAYDQGRYDADNEYLWFIASQRAGRLINQSADLFDEGILLFRDGQYDRAAVKWLGAGDVNQGSAATRLHAGHAMFALGRYADGVIHLSRAFELSPSLAYKSYDVRDEYGDHAEFHSHLMRLKDHVARYPNDPAGLTMLGYVLFFTEGPGGSLRYLQRAAQLDPRSFFIPKLLNLARQASPADGIPLPQHPYSPPMAAPTQSGWQHDTSGNPPTTPSIRRTPPAYEVSPPVPQPRHKQPSQDPSEKVHLVRR